MTGSAISVHIANNVILPSACIRDISYSDGFKWQDITRRSSSETFNIPTTFVSNRQEFTLHC
jgi:hypothetical protein